MSETIHFEEKEYRALETIAKKTGFKNVKELANTAIIRFFIENKELDLQPEQAKELAKLMIGNPDKSIEELLRQFKTPQIETVEVTVRIPKKLLAFMHDKRSADLEDYLSSCLTATLAADIDAGAYGYASQIKKEYHLKDEFKFYAGH